MEFGVKPDVIGGQGGGEVCHCELIVTLALDTNGIGQLILMEIYD